MRISNIDSLQFTSNHNKGLTFDGKTNAKKHSFKHKNRWKEIKEQYLESIV